MNRQKNAVFTRYDRNYRRAYRQLAKEEDRLLQGSMRKGGPSPISTAGKVSRPPKRLRRGAIRTGT